MSETSCYGKVDGPVSLQERFFSKCQNFFLKSIQQLNNYKIYTGIYIYFFDKKKLTEQISMDDFKEFTALSYPLSNNQIHFIQCNSFLFKCYTKYMSILVQRKSGS